MNLTSEYLTANSPLFSMFSTFNTSLSFLAAISTIGFLLSIAFLQIDANGRLQNRAIQLRNRTFFVCLIWLATSALQIVLTLAKILDVSVSEALSGGSLRSFLFQIELGQYLLAQLLVIALVTIIIRRINSVLAATVTLCISLLGLIVPIFQSHSASSGSHQLAIGSLVVHVAALALWVGGIFALVVLSKEDRKIALPRFSQMALWAAIAVVVSGATNAWVRLNFQAAWSSAYARIVIIKIVLTLILIYLGWRNRRSLSKSDTSGLGFITRIVIVEAVLMCAIVVLGSWLSQLDPPIRSTVDFSPATAIVGFPTPAEPTIGRILWAYQADGLILGILICLVALYVKGVVVLSRRGDKWPVGRTISFACAIASVDFATSGGLGVYAMFSFQYHMIAHMVLGMIAPIFFVLSAPITLALRSLPQGRTPEEGGVRAMLISFLHSRYSVVLTNPLTALALFDGSLFVLYFTNLFGNLMNSHAGHLFMNIHFLLVGFLFFHIIIGIDPNPRKVPHIVRIVMLFAAMSIHAFFSIALISSTTLIDQGFYASLKTPWLTDLLADQNAAGSIGWAMGEIPIILALIATFIQWMRADKRETKRIDRNEARLAAMGEPDELAQYNNYLAQLQRRSEKEGN
jgi:cytochrome c oxidase assembly factor CtaG/putative copper export protein